MSIDSNWFQISLISDSGVQCRLSPKVTIEVNVSIQNDSKTSTNDIRKTITRYVKKCIKQQIRVVIFVFLTGLPRILSAQEAEITRTHNNIYVISNFSQLQNLPKTLVLIDVKTDCKFRLLIFKDTASVTAIPQRYLPAHNERSNIQQISSKHGITVHGNIMYDFYHQSHLDTPYAGNDLNQHTLTTFLDIRLKNDYPLRIYFTTRLSNSNFLRNLTNLNFQYNPATFFNIVRDKIRNRLQQQLDTGELSALRQTILEKMREEQSLKSWINTPSLFQKLVEAREAAYVRSKSGAFQSPIPAESSSFTTVTASTTLYNKWQWPPTAFNQDSLQQGDSLQQKIELQYAEKQRQLDSLRIEVRLLQSKYNIASDSISNLKKSTARDLAALHDPSELTSLSNRYHLTDSLPKNYKVLLAVKKFGIGTSLVDYSELSAKNLTVTGLQVEYSPKYYYAVAGGVINYRFRDYLLPERTGPRQYLGLVRFGKQVKNGSSLILTYYYGRKVLYNYYTTDSLLQLAMPSPNYNLMGVTLENKIKLNPNSVLTAEIAKSSLPYYHSTTPSKGLTGTFDFNTHSNEAYSLKINSNLFSGTTRLQGYYKHYGANFQSFTLASTSSEQTAWLVQVDQDLFRKQFSVNASVRKNDYVDPFLNQQYVNNTIFKSIQVSLHKPGFPVLTVGYYPTTQLTRLNDSSYTENVFNSFTATASFMYNRRHTAMSTTIMYIKFYNNPVDSGFAYFNTRNFFLTHSVYFPFLTLQTVFSDAINTKYSLWSCAGSLQMRARKWLSLGGGLKYNKQNLMENPLIGYQLNGNITIGNLGSLQIRGERTFIPSINQQLVPNNVGRLTFYRNF